LFDVEQAGIGAPQEQHRGAKLRLLLNPDYRAAGWCKRGINWEALGESSVKAVAERDRSFICDLELHPDHRRNTKLHEAGRDPREGIDV
jgi:hypothetical protein